MTTWNYIIGNEKDFEGAPDWATHRMFNSVDGKMTHHNQAFTSGIEEGALWETCDGKKLGAHIIMPKNWYTIAQREPVESPQWVYYFGTPEMFARMSEDVTHLFRNKQTGVITGVGIRESAACLLDTTKEIIGHRGLVTDAAPIATNDNINHPLRYTKGDIECIDAIKAATVGKTGIEAVDVGHVIRYLWRYEEKDGLESVKKAEWYIKHLINELENNK